MINGKKYISGMFSLAFFVCMASVFVDLVGTSKDTRTEEEKEDLREKFELYKKEGCKDERFVLLDIEEAINEDPNNAPDICDALGVSSNKTLDTRLPKSDGKLLTGSYTDILGKTAKSILEKVKSRGCQVLSFKKLLAHGWDDNIQIRNRSCHFV